MYKNILLFIFFVLIFFSPLAFAEDSVVLKAGISLEDQVPDAFFGSWRVKSQLIKTNSNDYFKNNSVDLWNISRRESVITLENPFSGAKASVTVKEITGNKVVFQKEGEFNNQKMFDVVELDLKKNTFTGVNYLNLVTVSVLDGRVIETKSATYSLFGDKISGNNVIIEE